MKNRIGNVWYYIKNYKFHSIFLKNFFLIILLVFIPLVCISVAVFSYFNVIAQEEAGSSNLNNTNKVKDMVDMLLTETNQLSISISTDADVLSFLQTEIKRFPDYRTINLINKIYEQNIITVGIDEYIDSIYIYSIKNDYIITTASGSSSMDEFFEKTFIYEYNSRDKNADQWISYNMIKKEFFGKEALNYISFFRKIPIYEAEKLGFVVINIDIEKLSDFVNDRIPEDNYGVYIVNEDDTVLYNANFSLLGTKLNEIDVFKEFNLEQDEYMGIKNYDRTKFSVIKTKSDIYDIRYVSIEPMDGLIEKTEKLMDFMVISLILSMVVSVIVSFLISVRTFKPISNIISIMENPIVRYDEGDTKQDFDELRYILNNLISTFDQEKKMEEELENRLSLLKKAQTIALQSQINPHFLFNTLETINWLAYENLNGENIVSSVITSFSKLLRISFLTKDNLVSLETEIEHAKRYIEIQEVRYKNKFRVQWNIEKDALKYKIIKIVLQPLLENSIYHGIKRKEDMGMIALECTTDEENLIIRVKDDGMGMTEEQLEAIYESLDKNQIVEDYHIGLPNINQRIKLVFGNMYGISIESKLGEYTVATITMPKIPII